MRGISITKLLIRVDVFYPEQGSSESPWKMNEAEVSSGHIIINSLGLVKSSAGLLMVKSPSPPRNENFNDKLGYKVPFPRTKGSGLKDVCSVRAFG